MLILRVLAASYSSTVGTITAERNREFFFRWGSKEHATPKSAQFYLALLKEDKELKDFVRGGITIRKELIL